MMITAPVQPGNSGGPLLSDMEQVVGVVVARASDMVYFKETGTLPQTINFAVKLDRLHQFLEDAGVLFPRDAGVAARISDGLSEDKQAAVVPVQCH